MKPKLIIGALGIIILFLLLIGADKTGRGLLEEAMDALKRNVDIEGVIQDADGNLLNDVTLYIYTEIYPMSLTRPLKVEWYKRQVSGRFQLKLPKKVHLVSISAEKTGYAHSSGYSFYAEKDELSAKDVVIRLIPASRETRLDKGPGRISINKEGKSYGYSFERGQEIPLDQTPDPADIYVYLEVKGEPTSYQDTDTYSVVLVGVGVEFCEAFLLPPLKYTNSDFTEEMFKAPEDGYVSRIEADNPKDLANRYFYFKIKDKRYGKFSIEEHRIHVSNDELMVKIEYYIQPDGTRDLADKPVFAAGLEELRKQ